MACRASGVPAGCKGTPSGMVVADPSHRNPAAHRLRPASPTELSFMSDHPSPTPANLAAPFTGACWRDVQRRSDVLPQLDRHVLLHAGPDFHGAAPAPVRHAAVQAILFEGLANDVSTAQALLSMGEVRLSPAQDHGGVTPLAQVVSASMPVAVVGDDASVAWAPLVEGSAPALRFGSAAAEPLQRLHAVSAMGLERLGPWLRLHPLSLAPVIAQAVAAGDECHSRTGAANAALIDALAGLGSDDRAALSCSPGFVLTILMAAACWRLRRQHTGIAAVGGNGSRFGVRLHGEAHWRCGPAQAPAGTRLAGRESTPALGAIGDSAVIDFCGLGGQALACAPALREEWRALLPADLRAARDAVIDPATGLVDPARLVDGRVMPLVNLALLDRDGQHGLIGRGFYRPEPALFTNTPG
jgi:hypothetical protein